MDKKKEFNRILIAVFCFIALSLLIVAAFNEVPVSLFSLNFSLGILLYPFIILELLVLAYIAKAAFSKDGHDAPGALP
ncbi:MAG: hypothetical protein V1787_02645 [Candidatus Micrarchaeota archaeon]